MLIMLLTSKNNWNLINMTKIKKINKLLMFKLSLIKTSQAKKI
jgi:hypothetical protein